MRRQRMAWLLVAAMLPAAGCSQPRIQGVAMQIADIDLEGLDVDFHIDVSNPLPLAVTIPGGAYALNIAGAEFLRSDSVPAAEMPAAGVGRITLPATFRYRDLLSMYQALRGRNEMPYNLSGQIQFPIAGQRLELPFSQEGKLPILKAPSIAVRSVDTSDVSLGRARVAIDAELSNPNSFALGLKELGYAVRFGEIELARIQATTAESIAGGAVGGLQLSGELTAADALARLLGGGQLGSANIAPSGRIQTPFGPVELP